jgi:hypothetical protein
MPSPCKPLPKTPKTPKVRAGKTPSKAKGVTGTPRLSNIAGADDSPKSSIKKGKRRLMRNDLVPERPQGPNIVTLFHKDVNLLQMTDQSQLYSASRLWMASDPNGELEVRPQLRGALAGFPLPFPDNTIPPWEHPPNPHPSTEERQARNAALDAVLVGGGGGGGSTNGTGAAEKSGWMDATEGGYMAPENPVKAEHMAKWQDQVAQ